MKPRGIILAVLVLCVLGGLIASLFISAISQDLSLPGIRPTVGSTAGQPTVPAQENTQEPEPGSTGLANGVTMLAQDTFQRPDQTFWGTSSGLRAWSGDANTNQAFAIVNHAGQITGGQGALQALLGVASADVDVFLSGTVSQFDADGAINLGLVLRWQDTNNWYKVLIDGSSLQLLKDVHGQISVLGQQTFKAQNNTSYSLRLRALGSTLFARAWPSSQPEPTNWTLMKIDTQLTTGLSGVRVKVVPGVVIRITTFQETSVSMLM